MAGGENIAADTTTGQYSREKVLERNPDVILIVTMGLVSAEEKELWQKYRTINAVKTGRIHTLDSYEVCSPTPLTFIKVLKELLPLLHPELKAGALPVASESHE
jgi:iron complex transport system substrate-binding protein